MKVSSPTHRNVNVLDDIVITKLKAEKVEDFLSTYSIQAWTRALTSMIGKVVYTFKVHNIKTSFLGLFGEQSLNSTSFLKHENLPQKGGNPGSRQVEIL